MKLQDSLSFQALSVAIPLFMKEEGLPSFTMVVDSDGEGANFNFSLPEGTDEENKAAFVKFMSRLDEAERLLSDLRSVALLKEKGVSLETLRPLLQDAEEKKKSLYGDKIKGTIDERLFGERT